jgi:hypothetical protein
MRLAVLELEYAHIETDGRKDGRTEGHSDLKRRYAGTKTSIKLYSFTINSQGFKN